MTTPRRDPSDTRMYAVHGELERMARALPAHTGITRQQARRAEAVAHLAAAHKNLRHANVRPELSVTAAEDRIVCAEIDRIVASLWGHTGATKEYVRGARAVRDLSAALLSLRERTSP